MLTESEKVEFEKLIEKCKGIMKDCGFDLREDIKYSTNSRFKRCLGKCTIYNDDNTCIIQLAEFYVKGCIKYNEQKRLEKTILHEMCHALPNGMKHGQGWLSKVKIINDKYDYKIERVTKSDQTHVKIRKEFLGEGEVICIKCNKLYNVSKKVVENLTWYNCNCGGNLKISVDN